MLLVIKEIFYTLFPFILPLLIFSVVTTGIGKINWTTIFKSFSAGVILVIPAIITIKLLGFLIVSSISFEIPFYFFIIISALNEEIYKFIGILYFKTRKNLITISFFIGSGFAISETIYLAFSDINSAAIRSVSSFPLHILTTILLSFIIKKGNKLIFLLPLFIHILYNYLIH